MGEITKRPSGPAKKVKMNTDGLREYVDGDIDAACHFVGDFAWCAYREGWSDDEIRRVVRPLTAKRAVEELMPYIQYVPPSATPPPNPAQRYAEGCALLDDDPNVRYRPMRWMLRPLKDAIERGRMHGWLSRGPRADPP